MNTHHVHTPRTLIAALAATSLLVTACGSGSSDPSSTPNSDPVADVNVDKASVTAADPDLAATEVNRFGADLLATMADASPNNNVVVSPFSVAAALGMTSLGARGTTADEMATVLAGDASLADFQPSMTSLLNSLDERNSSGELSYANSVWGQSDYDWEPDFIDSLEREYRSELHTADFEGGNGDAAVKEINNWVADVTHDRITDILDPEAIDNLTRMILVNAVYLKADWLDPFDPDATANQEFTTATGDTVDVPMMHMADELAAAEGDGWRAVQLPYESGQLSMVIAVPDDTTGWPAEVPSVDDVVDELSFQEVKLTLPKFHIDTTTSLNRVLSELGMPTAFVEPEADFSGMTTNEHLYLTDVVHQANITVDEEGTEAAAATAVIAAATGEPPPGLEVTADHPFTFWLRDTKTGVVLFTGHINDPSL